MLAFLDTEFTDLVIHPRLLSVGIVTGCGDDREFYAEVTDHDRLKATGWYGKGAVLPQFGKIANASCSYAELGARLSAFMDDLVLRLKADEFIELAFGYHLDWALIDLAINDVASRSWAQTRRRVRPLNVYEFTGFGPGELAANAYFKAQALAPIFRHHALAPCAWRMKPLFVHRQHHLRQPTFQRAQQLGASIQVPGSKPSSP